jgi:enediyne biosynthesis protein CalE5
MAISEQLTPKVSDKDRDPRPDIDAVKFRAGQRQQWNGSATGWRKWSELIDRGAKGISTRLVELTGIKPGGRVLDVACGYGEPSLTAAKMTGPDGSVLATDISSGMIAFGRERTAAAGVRNIEFLESDAASLSFPVGTFDAALSRYGIIFEPDAEATASRIRGFLKPGARMAICSWGPPERVPFLGVPFKTARQRLKVPPPPPGMPGPLSRPTTEALGGLLNAAGFTELQTEEADVVFVWPSPEEFTTFIKETAPPISALIAQHPPDVQVDTWAAITDAIRQFAGDDGSVRLVNRAILACGRAA